MLRALLAGAIAFGLSYIALTFVELLIHKLRKNKDKSYRWGVAIFSILIAIYAYLTSVGR